MKIVDKKKFFRMIIIIIGLVIFITFGFYNKSFSKGEVKEKIIYIADGDTLWSVALEEKENNAYYEKKDVRDIIYEIKELNNLENNNLLIVGQKIIVNSL